MKKYLLLLASLAVVLSLSLAGCGGGGGGGGGTDADGDGIPNNQDAFPNDAAKFASFTKVDLLGLQGATFSSAPAINDSGLIVGTSNDNTGDIHGVFWPNATSGALRLEFPPHPGGEFGAAFGLNNSGDVVGESNNGNLPPGRDAIFWLGIAGTPSAASPVILPPVAGAQYTAAYDINNTKRIVGESQSASVNKAVTWTLAVAGTTVTPSQPMVLGEPAGGTGSSAYFISEDNKIVGEYTLNGNAHGVLWTLSADGTTVATRVDLPPLAGDTESVAYGINADGRIVGESTSAAGVTRGATWTVAGTVATAAALGNVAEGTALAINDAGRLAGWTAPTAGGVATAAVWDVLNLGLFDSVVTGTTFSQGFGINATGTVVGMAGNTAFVATQP